MLAASAEALPALPLPEDAAEVVQAWLAAQGAAVAERPVAPLPGGSVELLRAGSRAASLPRAVPAVPEPVVPTVEQKHARRQAVRASEGAHGR